MCCVKTNLTHRIKIHTHDNSDNYSSEVIANNDEEEISKIDQLTLEMSRHLFNTGSVINMDNYYMSTTCALKLKENDVFCRGTI
jgi:hypothetical protein